MGIDFREYTVDEAAKQLALLETHLRQFSGDNDTFCLECCGKHLLTIEGLAEEGRGFFPEEPEPWVKLEKWSRNIRKTAAKGNIKGTQAAQWAEECRLKRKELQRRHMGAVGQCECVTGLEPCCPARRKP